MGISPSGRRIAQIVGRGIAPVMKAHAFRKQRHRFCRADREATLHLGVQSSQWNATDRARFTINLWSHLPALSTPADEAMYSRVGHCGIRIGHLMPEHEDYWWEATNDGEVGAIAAHVASVVEHVAVPYLVRIATLEGVAEHAGCFPGLAPSPTEPKARALRLLGREQEALAVVAALEAVRMAARRERRSPAVPSVTQPLREGRLRADDHPSY